MHDDRMSIFPGWRRLLAATVAMVGFAPAARAQEISLRVGVRSTVLDQPAVKPGLSWAGEHGRIYGTMAVQEVESGQKLVKPVDETLLMQLLAQRLNTHGFRVHSGAGKPDIVLSVRYGRGEVRDEKNAGVAAQPKSAAGEKLYLQVVAWAYPANSRAQPKLLWKTTMSVDDPDHRDLNAVAAGMLEAGAPYFDSEIGEPEITVLRPLRSGRVNFALPAVVAANSPKAK